MKSKRILLMVLTSLIVILANVSYVYADSFSVTLASDKQNYAAGQTVVITVSLSDVSSSSGIYGLSGTLEYDTAIFEAITADSNGSITSTTSGITALNNWGTPTFNATTNEFSILTTSSTKTTQSIMQISLKIKEDATLGKTTIMLKDLQGSNGSEDIDTSPATISINIKEASEIDDGQITVISTPTPTATATATATITTAPTSTVKATATSSGTKLPQTGIEDYTTPVLIGALIISLVSYIAYRRYKDI